MSRFAVTPVDPDQAFSRDLAPLAERAGPAELLEEETISLRDVLGILRRNLLMVAAITAATLAVTAIVVLRQAPRYQAMGVIRIADARKQLTGGIGEVAMEQMIGRTADPLLSQLVVLKGRTVLGDVVDREGLRLVPTSGDFSDFILTDAQVTAPATVADTLSLEFTDSAVIVDLNGVEARGAYGTPLVLPGIRLAIPERPKIDEAELELIPREEAIDQLQLDLVAEPLEETDAVEIQYTAADPRVAQRVVNTVIDAFQLNSLGAAQGLSRRRRIFLQEQLQSVDSVVAQMQLALSEFRSKNQVYSSAEKITAQQQGLMVIDTEREQLIADRDMFATLLAGLTRARGNREDVLRTLASSPGIAANPVVAQLYKQLIEYESARDSLTTGSLGATASHPDVQRLDGVIQSTQTRLIETARSHVQALDARIASMGEMRTRSADEIERLPTAEAQEVRLVQQLLSTQKIGDLLREELQKARISEAIEAGQVEVVNIAPLPREPIGSGRGLKLVLGLVLGLMLGTGSAYVREQLDTSIRRREDLEEILHVPSLAVIPKMVLSPERSRLPIPTIEKTNDGTTVGKKYELVTAYDLKSPGAEAFRLLRTNLLFSSAVESIKTLAVTSTVPGEGKTTTISNLAASFAQQGMRVLIVDCDMRKPRLHRVFGKSASPGLSEVILGAVPAGDAVRTTDVEGLFILPAGVLPPNPAELLGGERMSEALRVLTQDYEMVLLDTPPLMAAADAAILGARVDGVLVVLRAGQTDRAAAQYAVHQLRNVRARIVGAVLNDPDAQVQHYGGYHYYSYYGEDEGKSGAKKG